MSKYEEARAVYYEAKRDCDYLEQELAVARAKLRAAERNARDEWRKLTDAARLDACKGAALAGDSPTVS